MIIRNRQLRKTFDWINLILLPYDLYLWKKFPKEETMRLLNKFPEWRVNSIPLKITRYMASKFL